MIVKVKIESLNVLLEDDTTSMRDKLPFTKSYKQSLTKRKKKLKTETEM